MGATAGATEVGLAAVVIVAAGVTLGDVLLAVTRGWDTGAAETTDAGLVLAVVVLVLTGAGIDDAWVVLVSG